MKHRTGLHNKFRTGRGSYSIKRKARRADHYGKLEGRTIRDIVAGRAIAYDVNATGEL